LRGKLKIPGGFLAGFMAIITGSALVVLCLFLSDHNLAVTAAMIFAANVPLAVVEGIITVFMTFFLTKVFPEYVH
jgi:cobalt/nickel transport system permease protein